MSELLHWSEAGQACSALWRSEALGAAPRRVQCVDDSISADAAYRLACEGTALLWRGDFQNARQLLQALDRRVQRQPSKKSKKSPSPSPLTGQTTAEATAQTTGQAFHLQRQAQGQRARVLNMLLIELQADYGCALRRAPDWRAACEQAWGLASQSALVTPLRQLLGVVGAYEWRKKGVEIPALGAPPNNRIHPHYGVFSPVRGEYVDLLAQAPLPADCRLAIDVGVGTGVLSAVLARRGVAQVIATDQDPRALTCAQENLQRLGLGQQVQLQQADLFPVLPAGVQAQLVVCNPPWLPARAVSSLEHAVYDEDSRMLRGFLAGVGAHLAPEGQAWLILSDLAEHLGLRTRAQLLGWVADAGLRLMERHDTRPRHAKAQDASDPLHAARAAELTSLWRLTRL